MEISIKNTLIANEYCITLKSFFKDYFKYWDDHYLIPFYDIQIYKKQYHDFITSGCNCLSEKSSCYGHQFSQFLELLIQFQRYSVLKKQVYFQYFLFSNFKFTSDIKASKIKSWRVTGVSAQNINHLTYSEKLSLLKVKNEKMYKLFKKRKGVFS